MRRIDIFILFLLLLNSCFCFGNDLLLLGLPERAALEDLFKDEPENLKLLQAFEYGGKQLPLWAERNDALFGAECLSSDFILSLNNYFHYFVHRRNRLIEDLNKLQTYFYLVDRIETFQAQKKLGSYIAVYKKKKQLAALLNQTRKNVSDQLAQKLICSHELSWTTLEQLGIHPDTLTELFLRWSSSSTQISPILPGSNIGDIGLLKVVVEEINFNDAPQEGRHKVDEFLKQIQANEAEIEKYRKIFDKNPKNFVGRNALWELLKNLQSYYSGIIELARVDEFGLRVYNLEPGWRLFNRSDSPYYPNFPSLVKATSLSEYSSRSYISLDLLSKTETILPSQCNRQIKHWYDILKLRLNNSPLWISSTSP